MRFVLRGVEHVRAVGTASFRGVVVDHVEAEHLLVDVRFGAVVTNEEFLEVCVAMRGLVTIEFAA